MEARPRFARATIESILAPGPSRVAPRCPVFGACGGCAWQHVAYDAQIAAKRKILCDALVRIGGIDAPEVEFVPSPDAWGARGRARVLVEAGRVGFRARRSHEVVAIESCPQLAGPLDTALGALAADPPAEAGEWELALGSDGAVRVVRLGVEAADAPRVALHAAGETIETSPGVFTQANLLLLDRLAELVIEAAGAGGELLELFAGAGFFTLGLARRFARVVAVESDARAVRDLARNLAASSQRTVRVVEARAETVLAEARAFGVAPRVVVLDPPRGGVGVRAARRLAGLRPQRIVYVSCDPATLARDVRALAGRGFTLERVVGLDLFPYTPHVESVVVLERADLQRPG